MWQMQEVTEEELQEVLRQEKPVRPSYVHLACLGCFLPPSSFVSSSGWETGGWCPSDSIVVWTRYFPLS